MYVLHTRNVDEKKEYIILRMFSWEELISERFAIDKICYAEMFKKFEITLLRVIWIGKNVIQVRPMLGRLSADVVLGCHQLDVRLQKSSYETNAPRLIRSVFVIATSLPPVDVTRRRRDTNFSLRVTVYATARNGFFAANSGYWTRFGTRA